VAADVKDKIVAVVDEIADTGETLSLMADRVREKGAKQVITASLVAHSWAQPRRCGGAHNRCTRLVSVGRSGVCRQSMADASRNSRGTEAASILSGTKCSSKDAVLREDV